MKKLMLNLLVSGNIVFAMDRKPTDSERAATLQYWKEYIAAQEKRSEIPTEQRFAEFAITDLEGKPNKSETEKQLLNKLRLRLALAKDEYRCRLELTQQHSTPLSIKPESKSAVKEPAKDATSSDTSKS